jgi:alpha-tubulin suppressor-like RCC1 family protein
VEISSGRTHELALKNDGGVVGWGDASFGLSNVPPALTDAVAISTRSDFNLALNSNGTVFAWGQNNQGQTNVPPGLSNVVAIAAGTAHAAALLANGKVVSWGSGDATNVPAGLSNVTRIAAGDIHTLAIIGDQPSNLFAAPKNISHSNVTSRINVPTLSGKIYILEFKDSLTNPVWTALPSTAGNGTIQTLIDSAANGPQRFYRVRQW